MVKNNHQTSSKTLGKLFQFYLPAKTHRTYSCLHCRAQLASHDELISKVFNNKKFYFFFNFIYYSFSHFKVVKVEHTCLILCMLLIRLFLVFIFLLFFFLIKC